MIDDDGVWHPVMPKKHDWLIEVILIGLMLLTGGLMVIGAVTVVDWIL